MLNNQPHPRLSKCEKMICSQGKLRVSFRMRMPLSTGPILDGVGASRKISVEKSLWNASERNIQMDVNSGVLCSKFTTFASKFNP